MTALILARIQFAFTAAFHYIYPPMNIGMGLIVVIMEAIYLKTKNPLYQQMTRFWVRIFGLTFAIGVATGIVMEFEFGTNWATYSRYVGDVFGSALAAEGIFAFFLESGFLAVLLFGWNRVSPKVHFFSALMVCLGAHFSSVWIVIANSWMQTPAGFHIVGEGLTARAEITDFWALVFNPSSMERLSHVVMGAWQSGAFLVLSVSAYYLLRRRHQDFAKASIKIALVVAFIASWGQLATGHDSALGVAKNQPAKLAAFEGHYGASEPADLHLVGWVDEKTQTVKGISLKGMLSKLLYGSTEAPVTGLNAFPKEDHPPVNASFQFYHLMILTGSLMILISTLGVVLFMKNRLFTSRWYLWILLVSVLGPQIANQAGWFAAEVGRQPWIVQGLLRTSDALSKKVVADQIMISLIMFTLIYLLLFVLFIYLLDRKIKHGPLDIDLEDGWAIKRKSDVLSGPRAEGN